MVPIPVPPFEHHADAAAFHGLLTCFLAELKRSGDSVGFHQYLLEISLDCHGPAWNSDQCVSCRMAYPCRTVLRTAIIARFPAPWNPSRLATALTNVGLLDATVTADHISYGRGGDPGFWLQRQSDGSWACHEQNRSQHSDYVLADDAECCRQISSTVSRFGRQPRNVDVEQAAVLRAAALSAQSWYVEEAAYPYLADRSTDGWSVGESLVPWQVPDGFVALAVDDAARIAQTAVRVIPPGHPLAKQHLEAIARCATCRAVLLQGFQKFGLTRLSRTWEPEELPNPVTELSPSYAEAYASMQRHVVVCSADRR